MNAKQYVVLIVKIVIFFILFHFIVWNLITKRFFPEDNNSNVGDLGRLSYSINSLSNKVNRVNLSDRHIKFKVDVKAEIVTLGDSFSNGGAGGLNRYYQDYISTYSKKTVMNIPLLPQGFIETVLILNQNGVFDSLGTKVIILESIERQVLRRYSKEINWNIKKSKEYIHNNIFKYTKNNIPNPSFINNLNFNSVAYNILYNFDDNAFISKVYKASLEKDFFTCTSSQKLLFLDDDLSNLTSYDKESISLVNDNLNKLQKILQEKKIKLYFMPVVDKYNLYSKYIVGNIYENNDFFEILRSLPKNYNFIDTKSLLRELTDKTQKDIFYCDDSHWSYKSSEYIFEKVRF